MLEQIGDTKKIPPSLWRCGQILVAISIGIIGLVRPALADTQSRSSSFAYDTSSGLLTQEVLQPDDSSHRVQTDYTYDAYGHRVTATVSASGVTTRNTAAGYDGQGQFQTSSTNALSQSESWTYDARFGLPLTHTDLNGLVTQWSYDGFGRVTQETRPDGSKTLYTYINCASTSCTLTAAATAVSAISYGADGSTITSPRTTVYYDMLSRQIGTETQGFDGSSILTQTAYDANGNVAQTSRPYFASGGSPKWTVNTYDVLGRVTKNVTPNGGYAAVTYHGLTVTSTNDQGQTTTKIVNAQGQTAAMLDAGGHATTYIYDAYNNLTSVTDPNGNTITNGYDVLGHKTSMSDPDMGSWSYGYDALGQMVSQTDAKGQTTSLAYDVQGRVTARSESGQYSSWTYGASSGSHNVGKLVDARSCTDSGCSSVISDKSVAYDGVGRPGSTATTVDGTGYSYTLSYDSAGRVSTVTYPSGFVAQYVYNSYGYLAQIKDSSSGTTLWTANSRDAELHLVSQTAGNGVTTSQTFDATTGLLTNQRAGTNNAVAAYDYTWDTLGNLTYRSDDFNGVFEYACYDSQNRLTNYASGTGVSSCTSSGAKSATYDAIGNITYKSDVGYYGYLVTGSRPHALASVTGTVNGTVNPSYSYDANGNMTSGAGRSVSYTAFNMAATITQGSATVSLSYDADHVRVKMVASSGTTYYLNDPASGAMSEKQVSGSTVTWHDYVQADGKMVAVKFSGGMAAVRYFTTDHLGSVSVVTDESGTVVERDAYDAWGKRRVAATGADDTACSLTSLTTRGYTGHEQMDSVCLINANARIYDAALGKFLSPDSVIPDPYDSQSYNRYTYVNNRPLSATDPTGHMETITVTGERCGSCYAALGEASLAALIYSLGTPTFSMSYINLVAPASQQQLFENVKSAIGGAQKSYAQSGKNLENQKRRSLLITTHTNADGTVTGTAEIVDGDSASWNSIINVLGIPNFGGGEIGSELDEIAYQGSQPDSVDNFVHHNSRVKVDYNSGNNTLTLSGGVYDNGTGRAKKFIVAVENGWSGDFEAGNKKIKLVISLSISSGPYSALVSLSNCSNDGCLNANYKADKSVVARAERAGGYIQFSDSTNTSTYVHEFGHILGLSDQLNSSSIMYWLKTNRYNASSADIQIVSEEYMKWK